MNLKENGDGTVTVTHEELQTFIANAMEQTDDLRKIKNIVYTLLTKVGIVNDKGEVRDVIDMKLMMGIMMKVTMNNKQFKEDMAFLSEALPLIEKYKNL